MLNFVNRTIKKTSDVVLGIANSGLVRGASKLGAAGVKGGIEGAAYVGNKVINTAKDIAPKIKEIKGKQISDNIGKAVEKTMVGDYKSMGRAVNESKIGKI
ncbi:MAG: hypothetical protein ACRCX8_03150 [Sarcina sp.]